jgi:lysophospholipase L1-like esterase
MTPVLLRSAFILATSIASALAQTAAPVAPKAPAAPKAAAPAPAQAAPSQFKKLLDGVDLKEGDTFVFLGDSITHQCLYTQYIEDFYYTRFPKLHLHFHNAGVGGDRAQDALTRFDEDVAAQKPKYVSILLGMNDGGYTKYEQPIFDAYQSGMTQVLDKIAALGATAIPMTPTMYDSRANKLLKKEGAEVKEMYYNGVLSLYGSWLREQALARGLGFVDMWAPLNDITLAQRKKDANFTLIKDAVHPGAPGQVIMAAAMLDDVIPKVPVSQVTVALEGGKPSSKVMRGTLGGLEMKPTSVSFNFTAESLPWVLPPDAEDGYKLVSGGHHHSNEKVTVRDLAPGRYDLKIDGKTVGTYTSGQLAFGVELESNQQTPQYQQALKVALLNKEKNDKAMHPLRDLYGQLKGRRRNVAKSEQDKAGNLEQQKADLEKWHTGEFAQKAKELEAKVREFEQQIYQINQPAAHKYELALAAAPAGK